MSTIFPDKCYVCGCVGNIICKNCVPSLPPPNNLKNLHDLNIYPSFSYKNEAIRKLIWSLKYKNNKNVTKFFADYMYEDLLYIISELLILNSSNKIFVIPVPLHQSKKVIRGYNQSELLAEEMLHKLKSKNIFLRADILKKKKSGAALAKSHSKKERMEYIKDSFYILNGGCLENVNIILIDDVYTSGTTISEVKKEIKKYKPSSIYTIVACH